MIDFRGLSIFNSENEKANILEALRNIELTMIIMRKMKIIIYRTMLKWFAKRYRK